MIPSKKKVNRMMMGRYLNLNGSYCKDVKITVDFIFLWAIKLSSNIRLIGI